VGTGALGITPYGLASPLEPGRVTQQFQRLGDQGIVVERAQGEDLPQAQGVGVGGVVGQGIEHRQRRDALAQIGAGCLAGLAGGRGDIEQVVGELEGDAHGLPVRAGYLHCGGIETAEHSAESSAGADERAGLVGDHP
jgi:hypothetical protein